MPQHPFQPLADLMIQMLDIFSTSNHKTHHHIGVEQDSGNNEGTECEQGIVDVAHRNAAISAASRKKNVSNADQRLKRVCGRMIELVSSDSMARLWLVGSFANWLASDLWVSVARWLT